MTSFATLANEHGKESHDEKEFDVSEMIMHHVKDAHEWHLWGPEHGGTAIYLPVQRFKKASVGQVYADSRRFI